MLRTQKVWNNVFIDNKSRHFERRNLSIGEQPFILLVRDFIHRGGSSSSSSINPSIVCISKIHYYGSTQNPVQKKMHAAEMERAKKITISQRPMKNNSRNFKINSSAPAASCEICFNINIIDDGIRLKYLYLSFSYSSSFEAPRTLRYCMFVIVLVIFTGILFFSRHLLSSMPWNYKTYMGTQVEEKIEHMLIITLCWGWLFCL